jgi:hypothetical protein
MNTIRVTINYLGIPLKCDEISALIEGREGPHAGFQSEIIGSFFGLPVKSLGRETIERYCDLSTPDLYAPILPHSDKLFERLISPLKSAKRCYCFGEFLATIELCAHVGEMLAQLAWEITPITHNQKRVTPEFERGLFGRRFEKLGQERRIEVLKTFRAVSDHQASLFDELRTKRVSYFHLWSAGTDNGRADASSCFRTALALTKEILQIGLDPNDRRKLVINPLLSAYLSEKRVDSEGGT